MYGTGELQQASQMARLQMGFYCDASQGAVQVSLHSEQHKRINDTEHVLKALNMFAL